jgi:hypothetical protein
MLALTAVSLNLCSCWGVEAQTHAANAAASAAAAVWVASCADVEFLQQVLLLLLLSQAAAMEAQVADVLLPSLNGHLLGCC